MLQFAIVVNDARILDSSSMPGVSNSNSPEDQMRTYKVTLKAALWCWCDNDSIWTLLETAFSSFPVKGVMNLGKSFLAFSTLA